MSIGRQALVFGASGLVGGQLVQELLASGLYKQVTVWVRRPLALDHPLLRQEIGDLQPDRLEEKPGVFQAEDVYCCLGTTIKKAGSEEAFARVDRELPAAAARLAARQGARRLLVVSSLGADPDSRVFYSRTKGQMEDEVARAGVPAVHFFRPSLLTGSRSEFRLGEKAAIGVMRVLNHALHGPLRRYRSIPAGTVARAMLAAAQDDRTGVFVHSSEELFTMAESFVRP